MFPLATFMSQLVGFAKAALTFVINLLTATSTRNSSTNVMGYASDAAVADGQVLLTVPANLPAIVGGRLATTVADGAVAGPELWPTSGLTLASGWVDNGDGSFTCDGSTGGISKPLIVAIGKKYRGALEVVSRTSGSVSLPYDAAGANKVDVSSVGSHEHEFTATFTSAIVYSNGFVGTIRFIEYYESIPAWYNTDINGVHLDTALQNYGAWTNKQTQSGDFSNVEWTKNDATIDSAAEVLGALNLDRLNVTAGVGRHEIISSTNINIGSGVDQTVSAFFKNDGQRYVFLILFKGVNDFVTVVFDLNNGSVTDSSMGATSGTLTSTSSEEVSSGVWRLSLTGSVVSVTAISIIGTAGSGTPVYVNGQPEYIAVEGEDILFGGVQFEVGTIVNPYGETTTAAVTFNADVTTVPTPTFVKQDGDWAFKFKGTPKQTAQALKALFSFDSDATNYTEIQLNAANITANSVLLGVSNGAAVGLYTHTVDVKFETNVYYVAATKTLGIRSDDVSGDILLVLFVEDILTSHPVITALLSTGNRNSINQAACNIDNDGVPVFYANKEAAGW